jgi:hypothetical protein
MIVEKTLIEGVAKVVVGGDVGANRSGYCD